MRRLLGPLTRVAGASLSTSAASHMTLLRRWAGCATGASVAQCTAIPRQSFDASSVYFAKKVPSAGRRAFARAADTGATLLCDSYGGAVSRPRARRHRVRPPQGPLQRPDPRVRARSAPRAPTSSAPAR